MKKYVMAIGAGAEQVYSIKVASDMGLSVIAVDGDAQAIGFRSAEISHHTDIKDKSAVLAIAQKYHIDAVIPACIGRYITTTGYINEELALTGPYSFATEQCADKQAFHDLLTSFNLPSASQKCVGTGFPSDLKFPLIVKPRYGSGSKYVKMIACEPELVDYIGRYNDENSLGELILEEFIEGTEYGVDLIASNSEIIFFNLRDKIMTPLPHRQEVQYISPSSADESVYKSILEIMSKIISILHIKDSMMHADIIVNKDGVPYIIDISPRPAGLNIITKILRYNTGRDLIAEWIKYQVWKEDIKPLKINNIVCIEYLPFEDIKIKKTLDIDKLKERYDILEIEIGMKEGDTLGKIINGSDLSSRGYFIIEGTSYEEIRQRVENITNYIMQEVTNG